ncbi:PREDICTED: fidgetin-like protein 1 [Lupinus angustifolius]|nr:PREDICTED: fidgetin-like protein 1 [Lupinus angustifolius]
MKQRHENPHQYSSSSSSPMEEPKQKCWRQQVEENLHRLHSLHFGAELALDNNDFHSAHIFSLRLLGFLDSHTVSAVDEAFVHPIRREVLAKVHSIRRSLVPHSDRYAFEQAKKTPGLVFGATGDIDIDKICKSKFFRALNENDDNQLGDQQGKQHKTCGKEPKERVQAKLTTISEKSTFKTNSSEDCMVVERPQSSTKGRAFFSFDEEERAFANTFGKKRAHLEIHSPKVGYANSPSSKEEIDSDGHGNGFVTARAKLEMEARQKRGGVGSPSAAVSPQCDNNPANRLYGGRSYGVSRRGVRGNFVPPIKSNGNNVGNMTSRIGGKSDDSLEDSTKRCLEMLYGPDGELPEKLRNLEPRLIEHISNEIMDRDPNVRWDDIAGLDHAKKCVTEMVIWPLLRPDIFKGCRSPGKGLLLFGPPGTGKTMIGKAIAGEAKATFFYISASSLTSKWIGEGEKLVRALFGVASCRQPAVIFVDEIDSLLSQRKSEGEHESSRRLKTQFLIEMEGFDSGNEQILLIGATNRPQELDEAARRRLTKRLYIPLPSSEARAWIARNLLEKDGLFKLSNEEIDIICNLTEGYSGSDMKNLVKDASMGPLREALKQGIEITKLKKEDMRPVTLKDFENALQEVRPSVSPHELGTYDEWNKQFGSLSL